MKRRAEMDEKMRGELKRKAIHFAGLLIPIFYYIFPEDRKWLAVWILCGIAVLYFTSELLRFTHPQVNRFILMRVSALLRKDEHQKVTGSGYYLIGALLSIILFDKMVAIVSMLFLIFGDFSAAVVGMRWGRVKLIGSKSLEGSLGCLAACLAVSLPLLPPKTAIVGSLVATIVELLPLRINDNLLIPVISGLAMHLISKL
ncbi:hypothetical protein DRP77_04855 [Candidatus Poribacteria bacterium]|nr:MAG: hypothetical protein DRP77_04855 [Candidatus Poribacteria bacterium]